MLLLEMCSPALRTHLRVREHLLPDYAAIRQAISDWLFEELSHKKTDKTLNIVQYIDTPAEQEHKEEEWEEAQVWSEELGGWTFAFASKRPTTESLDRGEEMPPAKPITPGTPSPNPGGKKGAAKDEKL